MLYFILDNFCVLGALKPRDHCCYDICGAVIHIETEPARFGHADTLDVIKNSVKPYITKNNQITSKTKEESNLRVIHGI